MVSSSGYQKHVIFDELDIYKGFYENLADSVFLWPTVGTKAICSIDSYVYSSIHGTLSSIRVILADGRINDAYALLRKYHDSVIINIYSNLYLQDHLSDEKFIVEQIDNWLNGKAKLPEFRIMSQYIRSASTTAPITAILFGDDRYKHLRNRCNDNTHYNFYSNVLLNDNKVNIPSRLKTLDEFSADVRNVIILHVAYIFVINGHYMMSSDYVDSLECGMTPKTESQYWVAPFIQDFFDQVVRKYRPEIATAVRQYTGMHLA